MAEIVTKNNSTMKKCTEKSHASTVHTLVYIETRGPGASVAVASVISGYFGV